MNISWIVTDECGNESATPGTTTFTLNDNVAPYFLNPPSDTLTICNKIPAPASIIVNDDCDRSVTALLQEVSTKSTDSTSCQHFSYTINRTWTSKDKCGNTATHTQIITVKDTIGPLVNSMKDITIGCREFAKSRDSIYIDFVDDCSKVKVVFRIPSDQQDVSQSLSEHTHYLILATTKRYSNKTSTSSIMRSQQLLYLLKMKAILVLMKKT